MEIDHNAPFRLAAEDRCSPPPPHAGEDNGTAGALALSSPVYGGGAERASASEAEGGLSERIIAIARSWIGTPYVHQASLKGVGCDCLGLLRGVWRELTGDEPEDAPPYSLDWAEATGAETLYMALKRHAGEIGARELAPGDIALFRMSPRGPAKHCGVIASASPRPRACGGEGQGVRGLQHTGIRNQGSVPGVNLIPDTCPLMPGRPLTLNPSPPEGGEGNTLTLIHARQNKRVSEEPLSPFWRGRLAFVFRL